MLVQVVVNQSYPDKPEWQAWNNIYKFELDTLPGPDEGPSIFEPVYSWHKFNLKTGIRINSISWFALDGEGTDTKKPAGGFWNLYKKEQNGLSPMRGQLFYRYVLSWPLLSESGPWGRSWWHGALDEYDLVKGVGNSINLRDQLGWRPALEFFDSFGGQGIWARWRRGGIEAGTGLISPERLVTGVDLPNVSDAHAHTRWRFRFRSNSQDVYAKQLAGLNAMEYARREGKGRIVSDGPFTYADAYYMAVGAINGMTAVHSTIEQYFKDADKNGENGMQPPRTRFGFACADIMDAWREGADFALMELPEMQKLYKPFVYAGDELIYAADLKQYLDVLDSFIAKLAFSHYWDWSNPFAYPGQAGEDGYTNKPDFIELGI